MGTTQALLHPRWVSKELGEMEDLQMQSSAGCIAWTSVECETAAAGSSLSPSLSEDQRFTMINFWPKWTQTDSEVEEHHSFENVGEKRRKISKIMLLKDGKESLLPGTIEKDLTELEAKERMIREEFEDKLYMWLIHKVTEEGKGPNILDEDGQGVLHLAAALGYDWAIKPILAAGVSINFRDANGLVCSSFGCIQWQRGYCRCTCLSGC